MKFKKLLESLISIADLSNSLFEMGSLSGAIERANKKKEHGQLNSKYFFN